MKLSPRKKLASAALGLILGISLAASPAAAQTPVAPAKDPAKAPAKAPAKSATPLAKAPATVREPNKGIGQKSAPVTVEVFSDFQCPSCRGLYETALRQILAEYVHPGRVYLLHRDMPLPMHKYSQQAARYANAAASIGKFEIVEQAIYASQHLWGVQGAEDLSKLDAAVASVLKPAEMTQVRKIMNDPVIQASIDRDVALGRTFAVSSTPTVVVTHRGKPVPLPGGVTYPLLKQYIDYLLTQ